VSDPGCARPGWDAFLSLANFPRAMHGQFVPWEIVFSVNDLKIPSRQLLINIAISRPLEDGRELPKETDDGD
jgi:hypothetical protein